MAKKVLSILIGSECTKVCEVNYKKKKKNKNIRVYRSIIFNTPEETVEDGFIKDINSFGEELKNQLRAAKIKSDKVIFIVNSTKIASREIVMPQVKEKRIMDIIKTGASEYFPIDIDDYILSYQIIENKKSAASKSRQRKLEKKERKLAKKQAKIDRKKDKKKSKTEIIAENLEMKDSVNSFDDLGSDTKDTANETKIKNQMRLGVYAAPSELIKNYYSFARQMHFDIIAIDYYGNGSYQAIKRQSKRGTNMYVQMNERDTIFNILRDDILVLQRTVNYGLIDLLYAIVEAGNQNLTAEEILSLLRDKGILSVEDNSNLAIEEVAASSSINKDDDINSKIVKDSLKMLAGNITRMLDYYKSVHKRIDIDTIYLSGALVDIQGVDKFFEKEIGLRHKTMHKINNVSSRKKAATFRANPSNFLTLIGAIIKPVDFVPYEFVLKKQRRSAVIATTFLTIICLLGSAGVIYVSLVDYQVAKDALDEIRTEYEAMPSLSEAHDAYKLALAELEDLERFQEMTTSNNDMIKDVIEQLEKKLPSGTLIHSMKFTEDQVIMNVTANDDEAGSNALIAKTLKQLKGIDYFKNQVDISGIKVENDNGISKVNFTITCSYVN